MRYWLRTAAGLVLFFSAATAFDYALFELIAEDAGDKRRLVAVVPLAVVAAVAGGGLYAARGRAPWHDEDPPGWAIAVPAWSFFFATAGLVALAAALGAAGPPQGMTRFGGVLVGAIFAALGFAPVVLGVLGPRPRAHGGSAAMRTAAVAGQLFLALAAISVTLGLMDRLRDSDSAGAYSAPAPVAADSPVSLFRERPLAAALAELERQAPADWRVLSLRLEPNELRAELDVEAGRLLVVLDRTARLVRRERLGPLAEESFEPELLDPRVAERVGRLDAIDALVAGATVAAGGPGWRVIGLDGGVVGLDGRPTD